jgi:hypothetical protein
MGYPKWTKPELAILHHHEYRTLPDLKIKELLEKNGFQRTIKGISKKRRVDNINREVDHDEETLGYTPTGLARCLGLHHTTILKFARLGYLKMTPQNKESTQPIFRINRREIKRFLKENLHLWDHRKVDQYWLIDILTRS